MYVSDVISNTIPVPAPSGNLCVSGETTSHYRIASFSPLKEHGPQRRWPPRALRRDRQGWLKHPRFSWTRIKGESNVQGGGGNGSVEGRGTGRGIGADGGSPEGDWSPCRRGGGRGGAGALAPGQRWSASRKRDVVLRLLRGESLEALSREAGVEIYRLDAWRERAMAGLELGLKDRHGEPVAEVLDAAKRHIGELSMEIELLRERARAAEQRLPLAMRRSRR